MLTQEEIRELEEELAQYPRRQAGCVDALKIVQRRRGWISDETLRETADYLGMTADELEAVATFYPVIFRRVVGRHIIRICDSVSCWIMGYEKVYRTLTDTLGVRLGETTSDGRFTLLPSSCLGVCEHAPALMIDNDLIADWDRRRRTRSWPGIHKLQSEKMSTGVIHGGIDDNHFCFIGRGDAGAGRKAKTRAAGLRTADGRSPTSTMNLENS